MKHIIVALLLTPAFAICQDTLHRAFSLKDDKVCYERIIDLPGQDKDQLYKSVKSWGVNAFNSQKDVLQADDRESGIVAFKYFFTEVFEAPKMMGITSAVDWKYWQVMKVFLKDEKVKVVVQDVMLKEPSLGELKVETIRSSTEDVLRRSMAGKGYRERYYTQVYKNFQKADAHILATIANLEKTLKSGKSEFDF